MSLILLSASSAGEKKDKEVEQKKKKEEVRSRDQRVTRIFRPCFVRVCGGGGNMCSVCQDVVKGRVWKKSMAE